MSMRVPSRVLVAPSGFKESLSAEEVARGIATGVRRAVPGARIDQVPVVDGGEGSAATLADATGGELVPARVTGPVGDPVDAHVAMLGGDAAGTAVVEMASAAGLRLVPAEHRDPTRTTTYGVGELIRVALDSGATRILVGCGDSGTSDGGAGALQALGARVLDADGADLSAGGAALERLASLDLSGMDRRAVDAEVEVACNPHNVLTGDRGVARVFGPQKGATAEQVETLARAMDRWAAVLADTCADTLRELEVDVATGAGTGASGGLGAALAAGLGARLRPRFEVLLDHVDLDALLVDADLVITAEGAVDAQTAKGKVPAEIARRATALGTPVLVLAGTLGEDAATVYDIGVDAIVSVLPGPMALAEAIADAEVLVAAAAERAMRLVLLGARIGTGR